MLDISRICIGHPHRRPDASGHIQHKSRGAQHIHSIEPLRCKPEGPRLAELSYFSNITGKPGFIDGIMHGILQLNPSGTWLQIGANTLDPDGASQKIFDPLLGMLPSFKGYRKVFVEPIPRLYEQLMRNVEKMGLQNTTCVNAAITANAGSEETIDIFCAPEDVFDGWRVGGCSLSADKIRKELNREPQRKQVPAMSVSGLFEKEKLKDVHVVLIDVEGFDDQVLFQLPLETTPAFRPSLIVFERKFLNEENRLEKAIEFLHSHCYMVVTDHENAFAVPYLS